MADSSEPRQEAVHISASPPKAAAPTPLTTPSPKEETTRITALPNRPAKPALEMKKAQPLIDLPAIEGPAAPVTLAPEPRPQAGIDDTPMWLCWTLLGTSLTILIFQIWNYFS